MRRRGFLAGGLAALTTPAWAAAGRPKLLTAASDAAGMTYLIGLSETGDQLFQIPLTGRGHAATAHPHRAEAVAFARRPGNFAIILDCVNGRPIGQLTTPEGRHFYGHGVFSVDGQHLFTTENAYDIPDGRIGVWDANAGYRRIAELRSGGIGPHEILRTENDVLVVANGGIQTHPDFDRAKLNVPQMRPNLSWLSTSGEVLHQVSPEDRLHQNSIRHIAADPGGRIFAALQWQGDPRRVVPLVATCDGIGGTLKMLPHPEEARMKHYAGSIAIAPNSHEVLVTGPKGGHILRFTNKGTPKPGIALPTPSGVAPLGDGLVVSVDKGLAHLGPNGLRALTGTTDLSWDNHLVAL